MRLSTKARYGVRAVFDIAYHNEGRPAQARDIAERQEVPLRYLEQIFGDLRRAGLVDAKRGPRGGYLLGREADAISLGDVIRAVQGPIELLGPEDDDGADGESPRKRRPSATKKMAPKAVPASIWRELAERVSACFDAVSIADLCARGQALGLARGGQPPMYFI
jgi:Rrf2 family transcriptional regulator, iron-sulfur cluster assembly transcription factor